MNAPEPAVIGKVLIAAMLCTLAVACSKKVKEVPPTDTGTTTQPTQEQPPATSGV